MNTLSFDIPIKDVDTRCLPYIGICTPKNTEINEYTKHFDDIINQLLDLFQYYVQESQLPFKATLDLAKRCSSHFLPYRNFCIFKYKQYHDKLNKEKESFYQEKAQIASMLSIFMTEARKLGTPGFVDVDRFREKVQLDYRDNPIFIKYLKKITILENFVNRYAPSDEYQRQMLVVRASLEEAEETIDSSLEYSPYGIFDVAFNEFTNDNKSIECFKQAAIEITKNTPKRIIDLKLIENLTKSFSLLIEPLDKGQQSILRFAVVRSVFDQMSSIPGFFLFADTNSQGFMNNCKAMRNMTPTQNHVAPELLSKELMDVPFYQIIEQSSELVESANIINSLHFINNPFDLVWITFKAIKLMDSYILNHINEGGRQLTTSNMSFDDVFSLFCPIMAYNPPSNAEAVAKFLMSIVGLKFSPALDFAKLVLSSSIDYISRYTPNEEKLD